MSALDVDLTWYSPFAPPLQLCGLPWARQLGRLRRLPVLPAGVLPASVDSLANQPAGGQVRFRTNSRVLKARVRLEKQADMYHMTPVGQCGFDCYIDGRFAGCAGFLESQREYESDVPVGFDGAEHEVVLNLPLYMAVEQFEVGLDAKAAVLPPAPFAVAGPVVFYGTSITQGGCACRPGMAYISILGRRLNVETVNLGFSGSGCGEAAVARCLAELKAPSLYVLDYVANVGAALLRETFPPFVDILRAAHPTVPILALDRIRWALDLFVPSSEAERCACGQFLAESVASRRRQGDLHMHYCSMEDALGADFDECTVDRIHPTDLGFERMANHLQPVIHGILWG